MEKPPKRGKKPPAGSFLRSVVQSIFFTISTPPEGSERYTVLELTMDRARVVDRQYSAFCPRRNVPVLIMEFHHFDSGAGRILFPDVFQDLGPDAHGKHRVSSFAFG
jgi:hypothetical protein